MVAVPNEVEAYLGLLEVILDGCECALLVGGVVDLDVGWILANLSAALEPQNWEGSSSSGNSEIWMHGYKYLKWSF